ncbi:MAG: hypothetical protein HC879_01530 [Leptolyngbyaceae cyanobacterium SL_5_9]|nr:hypothetical protein [Leptolyngbyaceae cyanobacterium SL_5_9]
MGGIQERSRLLRYVTVDATNRLLESHGFGSSLHSSENRTMSITISGEMPFAELQQSLQRLNDTGVLSPAVYQQLQEELAAGRIRLDINLFQQAENRMQQYERLQPGAIAPYLEELNAIGILSDENLTRLLQDLSTRQIESENDFINYFDRALVLDLQNNSSDPNDYFLRVHQAIAQMLTETDIADIRLEDFRLEILQEPDLYHLNEDHNLIVSARVNGRLYQQGSYYFSSSHENGFLGQINEGDSYRQIDIEEAIHLFNKILRDQASPYRVYAVADEGDRFGILALTEQQVRRYPGISYSSHRQNYDNSLTSDRIEEILTLFEQISLFGHLTSTQINAGRQRIAQPLIIHPYELLKAFDNTLVVIEDWETGNTVNPYQEFTREFAVASRGAFTPTDISNEFDWDNETAGQSFTINGTRYSTKLEFQGDWLDPEFFTFIKEVVEETSPEGKFYPLYGEYELIGYLFLTEQQHRTLEAEELLTLEPPTNPYSNTRDSQNSTVQSYALTQPRQLDQPLSGEQEGWSYIGSMNRAQQAYYLEHMEFASTLRQLGLGISEETNFYQYAVVPQSDLSRGVIMTAQSKSDELRSFTSAVWVVGIRLGSSVVESTTMAAICETEQASTTPPEMVLPTDITQTSISCPPGSRRVDRP